MDVEHGTAGKKRLKQKKRAASFKIKKKPKVKRRARRQPRQTQRQKQTVNIKMGSGYGDRYKGPSNWSPFVVGAAMNTVQQPPINLTFVGDQGAFQADRRHNASASPIPAAAPPLQSQKPIPTQHPHRQPAAPPRAHPQHQRRAIERAFLKLYRPLYEQNQAKKNAAGHLGVLQNEIRQGQMASAFAKMHRPILEDRKKKIEGAEKMNSAIQRASSGQMGRAVEAWKGEVDRQISAEKASRAARRAQRFSDSRKKVRVLSRRMEGVSKMNRALDNGQLSRAMAMWKDGATDRQSAADTARQVAEIRTEMPVATPPPPPKPEAPSMSPGGEKTPASQLAVGKPRSRLIQFSRALTKYVDGASNGSQ